MMMLTIKGKYSVSQDPRYGYSFEQLEVGMSERYARTVSAQDIARFAELSGDMNPVHLDAKFAAGTMFREPIAHGILTASYISTVIGTKLPGPGCIYVSQNLSFKAPVYIGNEVVAKVRVASLNEKRRFVTLACKCVVDAKTVVAGEALIMVPARG